MQRLNCSLKELKFAPGETDAEQMTFSGYGAVFGNVDADATASLGRFHSRTSHHLPFSRIADSRLKRLAVAP